MKHLLYIIFILSSLLIGCVFVDSDCHYETYCTYICDYYGYDCIPDYCWDEWVCEDYYEYHTQKIE